MIRNFKSTKKTPWRWHPSTKLHLLHLCLGFEGMNHDSDITDMRFQKPVKGFCSLHSIRWPKPMTSWLWILDTFLAIATSSVEKSTYFLSKSIFDSQVLLKDNLFFSLTQTLAFPSYPSICVMKCSWHCTFKKNRLSPFSNEKIKVFWLKYILSYFLFPSNIYFQNHNTLTPLAGGKMTVLNEGVTSAATQLNISLSLASTCPMAYATSRKAGFLFLKVLTRAVRKESQSRYIVCPYPLCIFSGDPGAWPGTTSLPGYWKGWHTLNIWYPNAYLSSQTHQM